MSGKLSRDSCVSVCTDGAAATAGRLSDFTTRIKEVAARCPAAHCVIHCEFLKSRRLRGLNQVMNGVIEVMHYVKTRSPNSHFFGQLCDSADVEHMRLLLRVSRGEALPLGFELRQPLSAFLCEERSPLTDFNYSVAKPSYLCDTFARSSELSLSLHGKAPTVF